MNRQEKTYQVFVLQEGALHPLKGYNSLVWLRPYLQKVVESGAEVYVRRWIVRTWEWYQYSEVSASGLGYVSLEQSERIRRADSKTVA